MKRFDLVNTIFKAGINNCRFFIDMRPVHPIPFLGIGYTSSSDHTRSVPTLIQPDRYDIKDNYKISLKSMFTRFGSESFYLSDLAHHLEKGYAQLFIEIPSNKATEAISNTSTELRVIMKMRPQRKLLGITFTSKRDEPVYTVATLSKKGINYIATSIYEGFGSMKFSEERLEAHLTDKTMTLLVESEDTVSFRNDRSNHSYAA
jgi:hypothetical protein